MTPLDEMKTWKPTDKIDVEEVKRRVSILKQLGLLKMKKEGGEEK